ncbi:MAG: hypothetical protein Q7S51_03820 [Gallionellaceae bacterium]|nr:hypothetical protein [Gallionellaceae bacterium]
MSNKIFSVFLGAVIWLVSGSLVNAQEPIAIIGHGSMFDHEGKQIKATPEFIEQAQNYYISELSTRLQPAQLKKFNAERTRFLNVPKRESNPGGQEPDRQAALIINSALIDWLIKETSLADAGEMQGKNNLIKAKLQKRLFSPEVGSPYTVPRELADVLAHKTPN